MHELIKMAAAFQIFEKTFLVTCISNLVLL